MREEREQDVHEDVHRLRCLLLLAVLLLLLLLLLLLPLFALLRRGLLTLLGLGSLNEVIDAARQVLDGGSELAPVPELENREHAEQGSHGGSRGDAGVRPGDALAEFLRQVSHLVERGKEGAANVRALPRHVVDELGAATLRVHRAAEIGSDREEVRGGCLGRLGLRLGFLIRRLLPLFALLGRLRLSRLVVLAGR